MTDLQHMIDSVDIKGIETEIINQISGADSHGYELKLAILLSILAEESLRRLESIDKTSFPSLLNERMEKLEKAHLSKYAEFKEHRQINASTLSCLDNADSRLNEIDRQIASLFEEYDELLRQALGKNQSTPIG